MTTNRKNHHYSDFARELRILRRRAGLSQSEAAKHLDVSRMTYCAWELGITDPLAVAKEGALRRLRELRQTI